MDVLQDHTHKLRENLDLIADAISALSQVRTEIRDVLEAVEHMYQSDNGS